MNKIEQEEMNLEDRFRLSSYLHRSCGFVASTNSEENYEDHNYMRAPNWRPDLVFSKPVRTLFVHPPNQCLNRDEDDQIDVESEETSLPPVYDAGKACVLMDECEKHVNFHHPDEGSPDWEDHISKFNWTTMQSRVFNKVVRILHSDRLARLAQSERPNEPVLRRVTVDRTARRLRQALASVTWNTKYTQWLHGLLMDNLPSSLLVGYLEALQTLKSKVPSLLDRMLAGSGTRSTLITPNYELMNIVHKRPWDPLSGGILRHRPKKLPRDPILVMVPSGPGSSTMSNSRTHHWMANLSGLGTVVCVYSSPGRVAGKTTVVNCLDHMLASTRAKVTELHNDYGDKPVILVGIGSGATLACQVALVENVTAVVCLGFPMYTVEDSRGTPDDSLLNLQVPVLFVVGQNATTCSVGDVEDMRDKLNTMTALVVVGGADDQLRLTKAKKTRDGVTQSMVDKCVMDEVGDFLGTLLAPDYVPPVKPMIVHHSHPPIEPSPSKRPMARPVERKRKSDIMVPTNSDAAPPPPKKAGRKPKISMMQKMVQNKWGNQLPLSASDSPRSTIVVSTATTTAVTQAMTLATKPVVLEKKGTKYTIQNSSSAPPLRPLNPESTITVVAASSPTITAAANQVKRSVPGGQLTSLSSILQPGTKGSISSGSCSVSTDKSMAVTDSTPILNELNILDIPVILGDQNPDELLSTVPMVSAPQPKLSPVKYILTNPNKRGATVKYPQPVKCTKIFISKGPDSSVLGGVEKAGPSKNKPKIRHIPATKHSQIF